MAPDFLYRIDLLESNAKGHVTLVKMPAGIPARPLPPYALASRLSYFLWSSIPDQELLQHAAAGDLRRPEVLLAQTRRMLNDARVNGLATEFTGNWLDFRRFETNNSVDRQRFPVFTNELREAMFQEPIRFVQHLAQDNWSILDLLFGGYTFVNPVLAKHYGMPDVRGDAATWVRVDDAGRYHRGGLLPMAVFLTQNSPGLRTSPVKRGHWIVQKVLGEIIPPPPPVVPELPNDEATSDLPVRDMLVKHREVPMCAACHSKFDSLGLAFEGYGPVGENRSKDLAGRLVDANATYPGGMTGDGFEGLQKFIHERRQDEFVDNITRKLLAYGLTRSLQLSDEALVERMKAKLKANGYRFDSLVETIVTSPQFLNKRIPDPHPTLESQLRKGE
jgi:hypothetical protein